MEEMGIIKALRMLKEEVKEYLPKEKATLYDTYLGGIIDYILFLQTENSRVQNNYSHIIQLMEDTLRMIRQSSQETVDRIGERHAINMEPYNRGAIDTLERLLYHASRYEEY